MQRFYIGIIAIIAFAVTAFKTTEMQWDKVETAIPLGLKEKKLVLIDLYTDWCGWCKRMDRDTYANEEVMKYLKENFISSKMNPEKEGSLEFHGKKYSYAEFNKALGVSGYPATAFIDREGKLLTVTSGYYGPKDFIKVLKYFGDEVYKTVNWDEYSKAKTK